MSDKPEVFIMQDGVKSKQSCEIIQCLVMLLPTLKDFNTLRWLQMLENHSIVHS